MNELLLQKFIPPTTDRESLFVAKTPINRFASTSHPALFLLCEDCLKVAKMMLCDG